MLLSFMFVIIGAVTAQNQKVSGVVISEEDGLPIVGATILVEGTTLGTITSIDGDFVLPKVPQSAKNIKVSYIGMQSQVVRIRPNLKIVLKSDTELLDEVMVVAYGTAKKESFTGSAAVIDNKKLEKRTVSNLSKALDGQTTGVITTSGGGQPGGGSSVIIRGFGSINASQEPLYVVDGIPFSGSINSINPADIASMTVLKDASAGALYGARGANGVVIINTKRGSDSKVNVNYKGTVGWASRGVKAYDMVDQKEFVQLSYEALRNGYVFKNGYSWSDAGKQASADLSGKLGGEIYNPFKNYTWDTIINPETGLVQSDAKSAWNENWLDEILRSNALRHEHQFSVSGGSERFKTMFSLGYLDENGILETTKFKRFSGRLNIDANVSEWFNSGLNASFANTQQNFSQYDASSNSNVWYTAQFLAPIYPAYLKDIKGDNVLDGNGKKQLDYGPTRPKMENFNSIGTLYDDKSNVKTDNLSARTYVTFGSDADSAGWAKGLKLSVNLGFDYRTQNELNYMNMYHGNQASSGGLIAKYNTRMFSYTFNQLLTWKRTFNDHTFDVLLGHEYYDYENNYLEASRGNLMDGIIELRPGTDLKSADSYSNKYRIQSILSRFNYDYKGKYYLSASWRTDGSSRFHKDNRWGNFWSIGGNWRVTEESFMENFDWLDNLSVKASYGVQGNDNLGTYYAWDAYYNLSWANAGSVGAMATSLQNKNVTWEKNGNFNMGFDARVLNGRLDVNFEYFYRKTTDMLLNYPMALSTGFDGYNANVGSMKNTGIEVAVTGALIRNKNFSWNARLMASTTKNKVLKLTETDEIISGIFSIKKGKPLRTFYMAKAAGVDPATGTQLYWAYEKLDEKGKPVNEYITSDYTKAVNSKYYQGSRMPNVYGSFSTDLSYKGFDLSIMTTYSLGGKIFDGLYSGSMNVQYVGDTWNKHTLRRWQKPGDITDVPRVELNGKYATNNRSLVNASYFALKNITLGYTIPKQYVKRAGIEKLRVSLTADNLALFTHLDGMDPQFSFSGSTDYSYAPNRVISFGVDINF